MSLVNFLINNMLGIATQCGLSILIYIVLKYRFHAAPPEIIHLRKKTVEKLIEEYVPAPLVDELPAGDPYPPISHSFVSYDVFGLGNLYKAELKEIIKKYGVGTCGPRGFYGTLDLHTKLEKRLAEIFNREDCILFSNYFTAAQTVVSCFCKAKNTVYFYEGASEPLVRGLYSTKASTIAFSSLADLRSKLRKTVPDKYVVVEHLAKNTGQMLDLVALAEMKKEFGFRIILDISFSYPFVPDTPSAPGLPEADVVVGALCYGFPGDGGFACGTREIVDYQRLSAHAYVFSASLPAFLAQAGLLFLGTELDYRALEKKRKMALECIPGVVSDARSPVLLVEVDNALNQAQALRRKGIAAGVNGAYLRVCVGVESSEEQIKLIGREIGQK